jgi:hypothetical protein
LKFRGDPIRQWQKRAAKLRSEKNPHTVLRHFKAFVSETEDIRHAITESTAACEAEIEAAIKPRTREMNVTDDSAPSRPACRHADGVRRGRSDLHSCSL